MKLTGREILMRQKRKYSRKRHMCPSLVLRQLKQWVSQTDIFSGITIVSQRRDLPLRMRFHAILRTYRTILLDNLELRQ